MRSAPTTEMYTRCGSLICDEAARRRLRVRSASPLLLPAQCTMAATPSTAGSIPLPVAKSPVRNCTPSLASWLRLLSTRTSQPAPRRRRTTWRPSVPVPPVTRMGDFIAPPNLAAPRNRPRSRTRCHVGSCFIRHYYNDVTRRGNVTDGRTRLARTAVRGEPNPPQGGGLPHARLVERGRRRPPGSLATPQPLRHQRGREPERMADYGRRAGVPGHAALATGEARGAPGRARGRARCPAGREPRG